MTPTNGATPPAALVTLRCTACDVSLLADPSEDTTSARLWHYGDGSHAILRSPWAGQDAPSASQLRAHVLALAVRLQDLADDVAALAERIP